MKIIKVNKPSERPYRYLSLHYKWYSCKIATFIDRETNYEEDLKCSIDDTFPDECPLEKEEDKP